MTRSFLTAVAAVAALSSVPAGAAETTYVADPVHSEASFQIRHLVSRVRGRFTDFSATVVADPAKPQTGMVDFKIKASSIDTANADRDKHLRSADFFDVEKFPEMSFKSSKIVPRAKDQYDVTGTLTIHGVAKEVTLPVSFLGFQKDPQGKDRAGFETEMTLNRKDFGIAWNRALDTGGVILGDEVKVTVALEMVRKAEAAASH